MTVQMQVDPSKQTVSAISNSERQVHEIQAPPIHTAAPARKQYISYDKITHQAVTESVKCTYIQGHRERQK